MPNNATLKKILIISHNSLSAGTSSQTLNFVQFALENVKSGKIRFILPKTEGFLDLKETPNISIRYVSYRTGFLGYFKRIFTEIFYIPFLIRQFNPYSIFALSNYFLIPRISAIKFVLLRHPYLVDDKLLTSLNNYDRVIEFFRRRFFRITLNLVDHVVVQSEYMKKMFKNKYTNYNKGLSVLPNPINVKNFMDKGKIISFKDRNNVLIYPSRYYPHKNHEFIIELVKNKLDFFLKNNIEIVITLQSNNMTKPILTEISKNGVNQVIKNIGEVPQPVLSKIYSKCKILFFPSKSETFGNSLVEGLYFGLPILAPNLPYAKVICGDAGSYFNIDDYESAQNYIGELILDENAWIEKCNLSSKQFNQFMDLSEWYENVIKLLENEKIH